MNKGWDDFGDVDCDVVEDCEDEDERKNVVAGEVDWMMHVPSF